MSSANVEIEVTRGRIVESRHFGSAAVMRADGSIEASWGDIEAPVYARSAVKPIQALPLIESGAADRFGLGAEQIALACASHSGEPRHVATVRAWLRVVELDETALECGTHVPSRLPAYTELIRSGAEATPAYNNCSGKHTGFLTTAVHLGEPTRGYIAAEHPVQRRVSAIYSGLAGIDLASLPVGTDGCGIPTYGVPLKNMALALARMADPSQLPEQRAQAIARIRNAMWDEPFMVAGTDRFCTAVNGLPARLAAVKTGAEGVFCGMLPNAKLGIALKIDDGAGRAAEIAMAALLHRFGAIDDRQLEGFQHPPVRNVVGLVVGEMRPSPRWLGA